MLRSDRSAWYVATFLGLAVVLSPLRAQDTLSLNMESPPPVRESDQLADHLLVVYNQDDPDSKGLADYYASRRNIPPERVLAISCPVTEEVTRSQFEDTVRRPILSYLLEKNWMTRQPERAPVNTRVLDLIVATHNDIWAIVLMRGVPLKIAPDPTDTDSLETQPELQTNAAAVDSELALLPIFGLPKGGVFPNPFYDVKGTGLVRVGAKLATQMILVTRLDGPRPADVRRMIDDSLYAEENRLAGLAVIDTRGLTDPNSGYTVGDVWLRSARDQLAHDGWTVKFDDSPAIIPATDPCNEVALYLGWYSAYAGGPWFVPPKRFVRGAIAYHLFSFSAATVRNDSVNWVGPLIANGAAASMGAVYEPILALTPHENIFTQHLLAGNYFAEAAYASEPVLSWMITMVGDPLYRPFRKPLETALADAGAIHSGHDDWLLVQQVQRDLTTGTFEASIDELEKRIAVPGAGGVAYERLGDLLAKLNEPDAASHAEKAYKGAMDADTLPVDRIRVGLKLSDFYAAQHEKEDALSQLYSLCKLYPTEVKRFGVVDKLIRSGGAPPLLPSDAVSPAPSPVRPPSVSPSTDLANKPKPVSAPDELPAPPKPPLPPMPTQQTGPQ